MFLSSFALVLRYYNAAGGGVDRISVYRNVLQSVNLSMILTRGFVSFC